MLRSHALVRDDLFSHTAHELARELVWRELYRDDVAALLQRKRPIPN